mgnify:CR=1 FL=1
MLSLRNFDIKYVKGVGDARAKLLESELGLHSAYDLLHHFPTSYIDRSKIHTIRSLFDAGGADLPACQVKGRFVSFSELGEGAKLRLVGLLTDGTATMECTWFKNIRAVRQRLRVGNEYIVFGKPGWFMSRLQMTHPDVDLPESINAAAGAHGVYPLTERLRQRNISSRVLSGIIRQFLASRPRLAETLPQAVVESENLMDLDTAIRTIHNPSGPDALQKARYRLKLEELLTIQTDIVMRARKRHLRTEGYVMPHIGRWFNDFYHECLPFELTGAQKRVMKEIRADLLGGHQMNRLVQGDVGSGKTMVALMSMLLAIDNGYQACLMAPTEILATQHYETISGLTSKIGLNVKLLTGSTRTRERRIIAGQLEEGSLHILIGTHALIEDKVVFKRLGFAVIDEQHRFGVAQRARLWAKSEVPPHILVMTATPIPRTLAMTVYGDLDVSVIDELPPGRKPVETFLRFENQRNEVFRAAGREIAAGHQVYIVYPLIDENDKLALKSLTEGYEMVCEAFRDVPVAFVHGRMKPAEKDYQMNRFASGEAKILVATTVIEVGVNVPNATTMIIENAERFGLSQLHQLRGRVGRGADRSFCILMSKHQIAKETRHRLEVMTSTTDGFVIAEEDMKMRGPGDIEGTMQSGLPFDLKIANLAQDGLIIAKARAIAERLLDDDPALSKPENRTFALSMALATKRNRDWSMIS